jgi:hypothetical protein
VNKHHTDLRAPLVQPPCRPHALVGERRRHPHVGQHHSRLGPLHGIGQLVEVGTYRNQLEVGLRIDEQRNALANEVAVLG